MAAPPSRGHRDQELVAPDSFPTVQQLPPFVVGFVELAEEDEADFVLGALFQVALHLQRDKKGNVY